MRSLCLSCGLLLLVVAAGCGGPKAVIVKGKLTQGGKSILADRKSGVTMVFVPVVDETRGTTYPAGFNSDDDTFQVYGPNQKGLPMGKYKVTLTIMAAKDEKPVEKFNQQYGAQDKTPIVVDVTGPDLNIDLANFKGS